MWIFGLLCLLSVAVALPAPQVETASETGPFTNVLESSGSEKDKEVSNENNEEVFPLQEIPEPSQSTVPPVAEVEAPIEENNPESSSEKVEEDKENPSNGENKEEENKPEEQKPEDQQPVVVTLDVNRPSFLANLFSQFPISWPPQFSLPSFHIPTFSSWFGSSGQRGRFVNPNDYYAGHPSFRYVFVE